MHIKDLLARSLWLGAALFWTIAMAVLCLASFNNFSIKFHSSVLDKVVHFCLHFFFIFFWGKYYLKPICSRATLLKLLIASFLYGILLEWAQAYFTIGRKADVVDVLANVSGSLFGAVWLLFCERKSPSMT